MGRLERGDRIRPAVHGPAVQDIRGIVELHHRDKSPVLHHRSVPIVSLLRGPACRTAVRMSQPIDGTVSDTAGITPPAHDPDEDARPFSS